MASKICLPEQHMNFTEVRMLLGEVGRIREERRALQQYADCPIVPYVF